MAPLLGIHLASISGVAILEGFLFAFLIAGLVVLVLIVMGRANRSTTLPFGPFLVAGTLSVMVIHA